MENVQGVILTKANGENNDPEVKNTPSQNFGWTRMASIFLEKEVIHPKFGPYWLI